uniref:ribosomal protein L32 n=1 Tax=Hypnea cornuta TaxID=105603 RepID=UPI0027DA5DCF|nr:ribosomal protein L32 [Hypnea cornuta]WCH55644.1 ribosomal protein L32 [Hypnea cornuta]
MAVPKKRTSKSKSKSRKANWKHKAYYKSQKALSLAKSLINGKNSNFIYIDSNNRSENNI